MEQKSEKSLATLCKADKLTRCDYFSDTYTNVLTVNGEKKLMDITHISLPFKSNREKAVMKYFDISRNDMEELYQTLANCVTNNAKTTTYLNRIGTPSVLNILKIDAIKRKTGRGSDIYMVTEHLRPMVQTYFNGETTIGDIFNLGARLAKLVKDIHQSGDESVSIRAIDPEQIYVDDAGKYVFGCFQYAFNPQSSQDPFPMAETAPLHIHPNVAAGQKGDLGTDMYTISSILWSLLNGDGFDKVTPTGTPPKYATDEMVAVLEMGFNADPDMFAQFRKQLNEILKKLTKSGDVGNKIPVPLAERCISAPLARLDLEETLATAIVPTEVTEEEIPEITDAVIEEPVAEAAPVESAEEIPATGTEEVPAAITEEVSAEIVEETPADVVEEAPVETTEDVHAAEFTAPVEAAIPEEPESAALEEEIVEIEDVEEVEEPASFIPVKMLNTDAFLKDATPESTFVPEEPEKIMDFSVVYNKPKFLLRQLMVAIGLGLVLAVVVYLSVATHLFSLI